MRLIAPLLPVRRRPFAADPAFSVVIGDFRVYDRALTAGETVALAGDTTIATRTFEVTLHTEY